MKLHKLAAALAFWLWILFALAYAEAAEDRSIRPFKAQVPQAELDNLRIAMSHSWDTRNEGK